MPRYDPDLIAALAEGRLDPEEAATLEREITADPIAAAELAAHRLVLETIGATEAPRMTMAERSTLRESVSSALGVTAAEHTETASTPTRRVPWGSLGFAAAALAGLVAIVPVVGLLSTGGDDATSFELAAEAPTTAAVDTDAARVGEVEEAVGVVAEGDIDDALTFGAESSDADSFAPSTTVLRTTTTAESQTAAAPEAPTTTVATTSTTAPATTTSTTVETTTTTDASAEVQQLTSELSTIKIDATEIETRSTVADSTTACWTIDSDSRGAPPPERYAFAYSNPDFDVVVYFVYSGGQAGPFQVWDVADCGSVIVVP
jgi:hypothetical protein